MTSRTPSDIQPHRKVRGTLEGIRVRHHPCLERQAKEGQMEEEGSALIPPFSSLPLPPATPCPSACRKCPLLHSSPALPLAIPQLPPFPPVRTLSRHPSATPTPSPSPSHPSCRIHTRYRPHISVHSFSRTHLERRSGDLSRRLPGPAGALTEARVQPDRCEGQRRLQ